MPSFRLALLGIAAGMLYLLARLVLGAIPARIDRPALRAMLAAGAVLVVAGVAVFVGRPLVALHLPIAAATAAMTFGVAALTMGRTLPAQFTPNRSWALLVPAIAMLMIGGYGGRMDGPLIGALAGYGALALYAWRRDVTDEAEHLEGPPVAMPADPNVKVPQQGGSVTMSMLLWFGGAAVAGLAGYLAMLGLPALESRQGMPADPIAVVFLLVPAIVVPLFFELLPPCRPIGWSASLSTLILFALLCICFVLPGVALLQADQSILLGWFDLMAAGATTLPSATQAATLPATFPATASAVHVAHASTVVPKIVFPILPAVALRVDLLVLAGATLLCVPFAAGWLRPSKVEAIALIACYILSLMLMIATVLS